MKTAVLAVLSAGASRAASRGFAAARGGRASRPRLTAAFPLLSSSRSLPPSAVATAQYNSFTPVVQGFSGNGCNNGTQLFAVTLSEWARARPCGVSAGARPLRILISSLAPSPPAPPPLLRTTPPLRADGCTALPGSGGLYALASCSYEDDKSASLTVCTNSACSAGCSPTGVSDAEKCYISAGAGLPANGETNLRVHCASVQTAAAASVVVGLAVTLSLAAAAMCAFWVYKDKRAHKAMAAAEGYTTV